VLSERRVPVLADNLVVTDGRRALYIQYAADADYRHSVIDAAWALVGGWEAGKSSLLARPMIC